MARSKARKAHRPPPPRKSASSSQIESPKLIWHLILPYLKNQLHAPLSCPDRSQMRQPHLAILSRCCRLFHSICEPLLYQHIVTDNLVGIASWIDEEQLSNNRRYHLTKTLHLEYPSLGAEPSYWRLCEWGDEAWLFCGRIPGTEKRGVFEENQIQVKAIVQSLWVFNHLGMQELFPNLETIAVGSLYGQNTVRWAEYEATVEEADHYDLMEGQENFDTFLRSAGKSLRHVCVRDSHGPLSFPLQTHASLTFDNPTYSRTIHFSSPTHMLLVVYGSTMRWVADNPSEMDSKEPIVCVTNCIPQLIKARKMVSHQPCAEDTANIEIFSSTNRLDERTFEELVEKLPLPRPGSLCRNRAVTWGPRVIEVEPRYQLLMTHLMAEQLQTLLRSDSGLEDIVKWYPSSYTPVCGACSSGVPGRTAGTWATGPYVVKEEPVKAKVALPGEVYQDELD